MKKILLVVDIQNGFTRYNQTKEISKKIIDLVGSKTFDEVIATRFLNHEGSQYTTFINWHRLISEPDILLVDGLEVDHIIDKSVYTCVNDEFIKLLKKINNNEMPKHIFIVGVDTDCCVLKIAVDLFEKFIMPIVLVDYCHSNGGQEAHKAGIKVMERTIGKNSIIFGEVSKENIDLILKKREY